MFILIPECFKDLFAFPQLDKQGEEKSNLKKIYLLFSVIKKKEISDI